jgi:hypothetical protein
MVIVGQRYFSKSNDNPRLLVTVLLNFFHNNPLKTRFKKELRVGVMTIGLPLKDVLKKLV